MSSDAFDWDDDSVTEENTEVVLIINKPQKQIITSIPVTEYQIGTKDEVIDRKLNVDDLLQTNPDLYDSCTLMRHNCALSLYVQTLAEKTINFKNRGPLANHMTQLNDICNYLDWLGNGCDVLAKRIGQVRCEKIVVQPATKPTITRSSYNFCQKTSQCKDFYVGNSEPRCTEHHFVHSILKSDIDSLTTFVRYCTGNIVEILDTDYDNIFSSLRTICYVTRHMAKEIANVEIGSGSSSEAYHRNNPANYNKKKLGTDGTKFRSNFDIFSKSMVTTTKNNMFALLSDC
jgi:hypothetical protein